MRLVLLLLSLALAACARPAAGPSDLRTITIVAVSDWHGQIEPLPVTIGGVRRQVGGAAALKAYFDRARRANPGGTLVVTAGDAFGGTPPVSGLLGDVPAVEAQNMMGVDADTLGNHNFDHGLDRLRALMARARFAYVAANVVGPDGRTIAPPSRVFTLSGVTVGVIGVGHPDTPALVARGRTGEYVFLDPAPVANAEARRLRAAGVEVVVVLAHVGADSVDRAGRPLGLLGDLASLLRGVDVLIGDHTNVSVNALVDGLLVAENRSKGAEYAVIRIDYDPVRRTVVRKSAVLRAPLVDEIEPDRDVAALVERYRAEVRPRLDGKVGEVARVLGRARDAESALGNFVTDALRRAYGTDVAFDNSGGLRDDLPSGYAPADRRLRRRTPGYAAGPPWDIVRGDLYAVLPFNNVAVTFALTGRTLWEVLEHSVAEGVLRERRFAGSGGRFLQVSGFRYRFDPRRSPGARVVAVTLEDGRPVPRDGTPLTAVTSEFVHDGGDGYAMLRSAPGVTRDLIAETVGRALRERGRTDQRIEGRIQVAP